MKTIIDYLLDKQKTNTALWRFPAEERCVSADMLSKRVEKFAKLLKNIGVSKGDRVGFILDNSYDFVCLLYATWYLNAITVPLRPRSGRYHDYQKYISGCDHTCQFSLIIYEGDAISAELSEWARTNKKLVLSLNDLDKTFGSCDLATKLTPSHASADDTAIIQFSSGSTGNPKGVIVTYRMMMTQLQNIEDNHSRSRSRRKVDSSASWLPINHDMGLFIGVLSPVFSGCDNLLSPPSYYMKNPPRWFGLLSEHDVDFTFTTNSVLASSLNTLRRLRKQPDIDLSNLHVYIAAEKVSPAIVRRTWSSLSELGCPRENIHVGYGMAENALGATYTTSGPIKTDWFEIDPYNRLKLSDASQPSAFELASIGIPNDAHTITIRDHGGEALDDMILGELCIESPCVSPGYYNDPVKTAQKLSNGQLRTGDLAFKYDGEFYFYSRVDDLIVAGGRNIVPDDIEISVESLDFVRPGGSVLLGVEDQKIGVMQLHLLLEGNGKLHEKNLNQHCTNVRQHVLNLHDLLIKTISVCSKGSIEKTSSGKKRRKVLRQRLANAEIPLLPQPAASHHSA